MSCNLLLELVAIYHYLPAAQRDLTLLNRTKILAASKTTYTGIRHRVDSACLAPEPSCQPGVYGRWQHQ